MTDTTPGLREDTIGVEDAARILQMSTDALMRKTRAGLVPGAKFGRRWVYVRTDLIELIREQAKARVGRPVPVAVLRSAVSPSERSGSQLALKIQRERLRMVRS